MAARARTGWWPRGVASPPLPCRPSSSSGVGRLPGWWRQSPRYRTACPRLRLYRSTLLLWLKCCPSSVAPTQLSLFLSPTGIQALPRVSLFPSFLTFYFLFLIIIIIIIIISRRLQSFERYVGWVFFLKGQRKCKGGNIEKVTLYFLPFSCLLHNNFSFLVYSLSLSLSLREK